MSDLLIIALMTVFLYVFLQALAWEKFKVLRIETKKVRQDMTNLADRKQKLDKVGTILMFFFQYGLETD